MKNDFEIRGDTIVIYLCRRTGIVEAYTSINFLDKLKEFSGRFRYHWNGIATTPYVSGQIQIDGKRKDILLHRYLMDVIDPKIDVDHQDHDGLNNRADNLRVLSHKDNTQNKQAYKNNSTGIRGVAKTKNGYRVTVQSGGKTLLDKKVKDINEAIRMASEKRKEVFPYTREEESKCMIG